MKENMIHTLFRGLAENTPLGVKTMKWSSLLNDVICIYFPVSHQPSKNMNLRRNFRFPDLISWIKIGEIGIIPIKTSERLARERPTTF
jgi:hypothetical protein